MHNSAVVIAYLHAAQIETDIFVHEKTRSAACSFAGIIKNGERTSCAKNVNAFAHDYLLRVNSRVHSNGIKSSGNRQSKVNGGKRLCGSSRVGIVSRSGERRVIIARIRGVVNIPNSGEGEQGQAGKKNAEAEVFHITKNPNVLGLN